jgi:Tol biopolymer transport system component
MGGFSSETWGWNSESGALVNYSKMPNNYAEPEGIFPDGKYTLIESDIDDGRGVKHLDLYRLKLDGSGDYLRLTSFANVGNWKANNGVISPGGRYMVFQESQGGFGQGWGRIYLFDFVKAGLTEDHPPIDRTP